MSSWNFAHEPDPLGALTSVIDVCLLTSWDETQVPDYDIRVDDPLNKKTSAFMWRNDLNKKIILWCGDITRLNVEAIVNSTNESLADRNSTSEAIFQKAGPQLKSEIKASVKTCKTGEAKMTRGYKLPARYVIHAVGPRYNIKYKTAAESALFNTYRSILHLVREHKISSVGLQCIHSTRRSYPSYEGAHIAIRCVRRFLEKYGDAIETLIWVLSGEDEESMKEVYFNLMPLYFPRSQSEEDFSAYHLPHDIGNEDGEPVIAERQIRIMGKPNRNIPSPETLDLAADFAQSVNISEVFETSMAVGAHPFSKMEADIDKPRKQRIEGGLRVQADLAEQQKRYERWLRKSKTEDLTEIDRLRCFYQTGFDKYNRPVVVFIGRLFPSMSVNHEKAAMYFLRIMDPIVNQPYVVVYLHTMADRDNQPEVAFLKDIYNLVDARYKENLKALYLVHTTFWSKVVTWLFTTFSVSNMKQKIHHIPGLEYLYQRVPPDQLDLPGFVAEYDMRVNGTRYYNPDEDQAIGSL